MAAVRKSPHQNAKSATKPAPNFLATFTALKKMLVPYEKSLRVMPAKDGRYWLETQCAAYKGKPLFFAGVSMNKSYVSYYCMPIYVKPELAKDLSPELKKRKQGKCCFNFATPDPTLFKELAAITRAGFTHYQDTKVLSAMDAVRKKGMS